MEYHVALHERRLEVQWNGFNELCRITFARYTSRAIQYKAYLYIPKMPSNHMVCMRRRIIRSWKDKCGTGVVSARRVQAAVRAMGLKNGLHISDDVLVPLLEKLTLDDVGIDLDMIGLYQSGTSNQRKVIFLFGFCPDDLSHFLTHSRFRNDLLNYGRCGDVEL